MNYSTIPETVPQETNERGVRLSLKTILGAAAFASFAACNLIPFTPSPRRRDATAAGFSRHD